MRSHDVSYRLRTAADRALVLEVFPTALARADWTLLGYALMSSHIHLVLVAGEDPAWRLLQPLNTAIARRLNRRQNAFGPVMGERATTILAAPSNALHLLTYVHNNPVRAAVVSDPSASRWTCHRAYLGLETAPAWLGRACRSGDGRPLSGRGGSRGIS